MLEPDSDGYLPINSASFPDEIFRKYVAEELDLDRDSCLSMEERQKVLEISVNGRQITSLQGIEYFPELQKLSCSQNKLDGLDVSRNHGLVTLVKHVYV